jgi:hypothetical protein
MDYYKGEDRILYLKISGSYMPIACLTDNPFSESSEFIDTTTRDNVGWKTSRPMMQGYSISFNGLQVNSTVVGGNFDVISLDKLKVLKRAKILLDWKIEGNFPIVDFGKCYIRDLSEGNAVGEFITFSGTLEGFGIPNMTTSGINIINSGNPDEVIVTNEDGNIVIKTN